MDLVAEWIRIAKRDLVSARVVLESGDPENAVYLCQQAIEKAMKAHIQQQTGEHPPKTHNLVRLAQVAGLWDGLPEEEQLLLGGVTQYMPVVRYGAIPNGSGATGADDAATVVGKAEEMVTCLLSALR